MSVAAPLWCTVYMLLLQLAAALKTPPVPDGRCTRSTLLQSIATAAAAAAATSTASSSGMGGSGAAAWAIPLPEVLARAPGTLEEPPPQVLYTPPSVKDASTAEQIALAEHLRKTGAQFYGAYWCSFCLRQRRLFGAAGSRVLPYVECAEDGYGYRRCPPQVTGYPAWQIGGKFYGGLRGLRELQAMSGFDASVEFPAPPPPPPRPAPPPGGFKPPAVAAASTAEQLALAKHLRATGAKFYGAHWCRFCALQRTLFGAEGAAVLPYVECASDGYQSAAAVCKTKSQVDGYPTWEIGGRFYGGYQSFEQLATASDFQARAAKGLGGGEAEGLALGIDFANAPPAVRMGDDCNLPDGDCK